METSISIDQMWLNFKTKLVDEMDPAEFQEVLFLTKDTFSISFEFLSELLDYLEQNMTEYERLNILKHVLAVMNIKPEMELYSFESMIEKYEHQLERLGLNRVENFVGRDIILQEITDRFNTPKYQGFWIYGMGGYGKTTLVEQLCVRLCKAQVDITVIFVDLKKTTNMTDLLRKILHQFRSSATEYDTSVLQQEIKFHINNKIQELMDSGVLCLVLDNIEDVYTTAKSEIDRFIDALLKQGSQVKVIVTSRFGVDPEGPPGQEQFCRRFDDRIVEYQLGPLEMDHARKLMKSFCKPLSLMDDMCNLVLEWCGNSPHAIRLVSNNIRYSQADDFSSLHTIRTYLECLRYGLFGPIRYAFDGLDGKMQEYIQMLSVFQTFEFADVEDVAYILGIREQEALVVLMILSHRQLLQNVSDVSYLKLPRGDTCPVLPTVHTAGLKYSFHPLINDFLLKEIEHNVQESILSSRVRFCKCALKKFDKFEGFEEKYQQVVQYVQNNTDLIKLFAQVLTVNKKFVEGVDMSLQQLQFLSRIMPLVYHTTERVAFYSKVAEHFRTIDQHESYLYLKLEEAICFVEDEDLFAAEEMLTSIENCILSLNSVSSNSIKADFFLTKGRCFRRKREPEKALQCLQQSKALLETYQPIYQYLPRMAYVLNAEGNVYYDREKYDMSQTCHQRAKDIMTAVVKGGIHADLSVYTFNLGTIQRVRAHKMYKSDKTEAEKMMRNALKLIDESMACDESLDLVRMPKYAEKLKQRSEMLLFLKEFQPAREDAEKALEIQRNTHDKFHTKIAVACYTLGRIYLKELDLLMLGKLKGTKTLTNETRKSAIKCFRDAEEQIFCGRLTLTDEQRKRFIKDYIRLAKQSMSGRFIKDVNDFCRDFENGFRSSSSSLSSSSSSSVADTEQEEICNRRDSGISDNISSAEVMSVDNVFFRGDGPMQTGSEYVFQYDRQKIKRKRSSSSSSLSE